jgi:hypothetical protein
VVAPAMKKKYLNTLLALAILAGLWGAFTYYDKKKGPSSPDIKTESKTEEKVFAPDPSHIQSFTLTPKDAPPITCRRNSGKWVIEAPQKLPADQQSITTLLSSLSGATVDQVVDAHPANLKDFGLDPFSTKLEVSTDVRPAQFTLLLGDDTPTSNGVYAQIGGNPRVVTLASYLKSSLVKNLFDLRDKRAVTLDADQIQKIEVSSNEKDNNYTLMKNPEGVWDLALPPSVRADGFAVSTLVNQIHDLSLTSVVSDDKKKISKYGFGSPALTLKLTGASGSQTLVLGKKDGAKYDAMNSVLDPIFTLNASVLTQFQKKPADLRDKDILSFETFNVTHFDVETPKGHWTFEKQKDKWKETAPAKRDVVSGKMDELLENVRSLRADSFPKEHPTDLAAFGLTKPAYRFEVQWGGKKEIGEAATVGDHVYARRSTDVVASELAKTSLDAIDKALSSF